MPAEVRESDDDYVSRFENHTLEYKLVAEYTNLNFNEVDILDCVTFKKLVRDAYINKMEQSEEGREYLEKCWILQQKSPDRSELRKFAERL